MRVGRGRTHKLSKFVILTIRHVWHVSNVHLLWCRLNDVIYHSPICILFFSYQMCGLLSACLCWASWFSPATMISVRVVIKNKRRLTFIKKEKEYKKKCPWCLQGAIKGAGALLCGSVRSFQFHTWAVMNNNLDTQRDEGEDHCMLARCCSAGCLWVLWMFRSRRPPVPLPRENQWPSTNCRGGDAQLSE